MDHNFGFPLIYIYFSYRTVRYIYFLYTFFKRALISYVILLFMYIYRYVVKNVKRVLENKDTKTDYFL